MSYWVNDWNLANIRESDGHALLGIFQQVETYLRQQTPGLQGLSDDGYLFALACAVAFDLVPYGSSAGPASKLRDLLRMPMMACNSYCLLATRLFRKARPQADVDVHMAGWDEYDPSHPKAVGNHAQLFVEGVGIPLLLDPTVPLAAHARYDDVKQGKKVPSGSTKLLGQRFDKIPGFGGKVTSALENGSFAYAKVLYYQPESEFAPPE
ncbi:MAG TPA: hypothetical protein VH120_10305 [Gemmataceae bacterium]|jgi:hypothetical protein|nr:hypothetical protein [Gemmataceae bacterium]